MPAHNSLLVGACQRHRVALPFQALVVHKRVHQVHLRAVFGHPARDLNTRDLAAHAHVEEVDQVLAIRLDVDARKRGEQRATLALGQHIGQNVGVGEPLADHARRLAVGGHVAACATFRAAPLRHIHIRAEHQANRASHLGRARPADIRGHRHTARAHRAEVAQIGLQKMILHKLLGVRQRPAHQRAIL